MMKQNLLWWLLVVQTTLFVVYVIHQEFIGQRRTFPFRGTLDYEVVPESKVSSVSLAACTTDKRSRLSRLERFSNYNETTLTLIDDLIGDEVDPRDPVLVSLVRQLMDPPSVSHTLKLSRTVYKTPQGEAVDHHLRGKTGGFFVEAGGYDGERSSNSLFFEAYRGWNGLLVEADPFFYTQLLGKNRHCWSINACLSPTKRVTKLRFEDSFTGQGRVVLKENPGRKNSGEETGKNPAASEAAEKEKSRISLFAGKMVVPCFPLETLMAALERTKIDFFSLDVEGVEMEVLSTVDFKSLDVTTLAVEFAHGNRTGLRSFMEPNGYSVISEVNVVDDANFLYANDFVFAKKAS